MFASPFGLLRFLLMQAFALRINNFWCEFFENTTNGKCFIRTEEKQPNLPSVHGDDIVHLISTLPSLLSVERIIEASTVKRGNFCLHFYRNLASAWIIRIKYRYYSKKNRCYRLRRSDRSSGVELGEHEIGEHLAA